MATALLSVSNKKGLVELALGLSNLGWSLLASGGTAEVLRDAGLTVQDIAGYTGSPEILGGRVKTLHPAVHAGLLARQTVSDQTDLARIHARMIDLVVVNLYPFEETIHRADAALADAIESIDIGGVALIRAGAKNYERVSVITEPGDYTQILEELQARGNISHTTRQQLAVKAFQHTARYDSTIAAYLAQALSKEPEATETPAWLAIYPSQGLRYGENPHQQARLYHLNPAAGPLGGQVLQGKELSYNNLLDLDAAWRAALSFERPSVTIVKHLSPCGIASADHLVEAFRLALQSDPVSAFGGVIAANQPVDGAMVDALGTLFVECIIAPDFDSKALEKLAGRKNCRLVRCPDRQLWPAYEVRTVNSGVLWQTRDLGDPPGAQDWQVVSQRQPTEAEWTALRFAWRACQHVKSNAIVLAASTGNSQSTVGIGGGQPNRVDCVRIAVERAGKRAAGAVMASDAFFPFSDSVELAARAGISAVVQPGGSVRDADSIAVANQNGLSMVTTGVRHFRH